MNLDEFLKVINKKELDLSEITDNKKAIEAVKQDGYALRYVADQNQTPEVCLEAVKQNGHSLQYVKRIAFELKINLKISAEK